MCSAAATTGFLVVLLSVPGVLGQNGWGVTCTSDEICALKGSTVDMSCTYTHPSAYTVDQTFWHLDSIVDLRTNAEYTGRVKYSCERNKKSCTLTITDPRESDTAKYKFRFTTTPVNAFSGTGVSLTVTGLAVQVHHRHYDHCNNKADVECWTSCHLPNNPTFIWYKNGEKIKEGRSPQANDIQYDDGDGVACAVKGHEALRSTPVYLGQRPCSDVTYTQKNICALKGSSVDISCTYNSYGSVVSKFWFSPECGHPGANPSQVEDLRKDPRYEGRLQVLESQRGRSTLRITQLRESDAAEYRFKFTTQGCEWKKEGTTVTVTDVQMLVTSADIGSYQTKAELKCVSSCSPAGPISFVWVKNGRRSWKETFSGWFYPGDNIYCALAGHEDNRSPTLYAPVVPSVTPSVARRDIIEGRSVTLICAGNGARVKISWYKKGGTADMGPLGGEPQLVFESIKSSDSGEYYCRAESQLGNERSQSIFVNVRYPPRPPSVSVPSGDIVEGMAVSLTCSSDANPAASYSWFKEDQKLSQTERFYNFSSIRAEHKGTYHCKAENSLGINSFSVVIDVLYPPRPPSMSMVPSSVIVEGSSVNLACSSDANPAANYSWFKEDQKLPQTERFYNFSSIRAEHKGTYHCKTKNTLGTNSSSMIIDVLYPPRPPSVSMVPSGGDIMEGSTVTLTCSSDANPAANYSWFKENESSPRASGHTFIVTNFTADHSGDYYCEATNSRGSQRLSFSLPHVSGHWSTLTVHIITLTLVLMLLPLLLWCLWTRRKGVCCSAREQSHCVEELELHSVPDYQNVSAAAAQTGDGEESHGL